MKGGVGMVDGQSWFERGETSLVGEVRSTSFVVWVSGFRLSIMAVLKRFDVWYVQELVLDDAVQKNFWTEAGRRFDEKERRIIKGLFTAE